MSEYQVLIYLMHSFGLTAEISRVTMLSRLFDHEIVMNFHIY